MGPGESSQAYAFIKHVLSTNPEITVDFCLGKEVNFSFFQSEQPAERLETFLTDSPESLSGHVADRPTSLLLLCNSKSFSKNEEFRRQSPFGETPVYTLDSNWLFNPSSLRFPYVAWAKDYFINIPEAIFRLGLQSAGGAFVIPEGILSKIKPIGLIPSYAKIDESVITQTRHQLGIPEGQKYIFCYFSGFGAGSRFWVLDNLLAAVEQLAEPTIHIRYLGVFPDGVTPQESERCRRITSETGTIDPNMFFTYLSSADLVFQHQGLGTLAQSIAAEVPVIANVATNPELLEMPDLHAAEVGPFERFGVCRMLDQTSSAATAAAALSELLFDTSKREAMRQRQREANIPGESRLAVELGVS